MDTPVNAAQLLELVETLAGQVVKGMRKVRAEELGLDARCGYVYMDNDYIACRVESEGTLSYYGGFEYEKAARTQVGPYVFWAAEMSDRVNGHISRLVRPVLSLE